MVYTEEIEDWQTDRWIDLLTYFALITSHNHMPSEVGRSAKHLSAVIDIADICCWRLLAFIMVVEESLLLFEFTSTLST